MGRPKLDESNRKIQCSIGMSHDQRRFVVVRYGSVQKWVDAALAEEFSRGKKLTITGECRSKTCKLGDSSFFRVKGIALQSVELYRFVKNHTEQTGDPDGQELLDECFTGGLSGV